MKKYITLLFCLFVAGSLHAQIVGDISVTRCVLAQRDSMLYMELAIRVEANALTRTQSWTIIPEVSTADRRSVKLFPHVLVNGRYMQHMMERREKLMGGHVVERVPYVVIESRRKTRQMVSYKMEVPYEAWMADATLVLRHILTSPGNERRVFTVDVNGAVDTANN